MYTNKLDNIYEPYYSSKYKIYIFSEIVKVSKQSSHLVYSFLFIIILITIIKFK